MFTHIHTHLHLTEKGRRSKSWKIMPRVPHYMKILKTLEQWLFPGIIPCFVVVDQ